MHFLFLNQYALPDPSPTARLLGELADFLRARGHEVRIVSQTQSYHGRPPRGSGRLWREMKALMAIFLAGWRATRRKPDVILAFSSPPGLLAIAALLAQLRCVRLAHWAMDLYPELALALDEIGPGLVFRSLRLVMSSAYRRTDLVVALDEDMRTHLRNVYHVDSQILTPWPSIAFEQQLANRSQDAATNPNVDTSWTWLYSGNLGRAHEWETLLEAQHLLERRGLPIHLVFQGDGAVRAAAEKRARQLALSRCQWKTYVPETELVASLLDARILVVTQRPQTRGLLWPSKLAALEKLPRPILFVGPVSGAIAERLRARGATAVFAPCHAEAVANWVEEQIHGGMPLAFPDKQISGAESCAVMERWLLDWHLSSTISSGKHVRSFQTHCALARTADLSLNFRPSRSSTAAPISQGLIGSGTTFSVLSSCKSTSVPPVFSIHGLL